MELTSFVGGVLAHQASVGVSDNAIPLIAITLGVAGIGLPTSAFGIARKWSQEQPAFTGQMIGGATAVSILSILAGLTIILVLLGWLPSPREFL